MKTDFDRTSFGLAVIFAVSVIAWCLFTNPNPIYYRRHLSKWLCELKVSIKTVRYGNGNTEVFLGNLSDAEAAALPLFDPKRRIVDRGTCEGVLVYPEFEEGFLGLEYESQLQSDPARNAIRAIGPRAVPYLVSQVYVKDSRATELYRASWRKLRAWQDYLPAPRFPIVRRIRAAFALGLLGNQAKSALPELRKLETDPNDLVRSVAVEAIQKIEGAEAW